MNLNLAFSILIVLLFMYIILSLYTLIMYIILKNEKTIEVFFIYSALAVYIVFVIVIFFSIFKNLNLEFTL